MKFLLGLLFYMILESVLPLDPYIFPTRRLLSCYIVHLKRTSHLFDPKGTLSACYSSLKGSLYSPSSFSVYVEYRSDMRRILSFIWLFFVMDDHASLKF